MSDAAPSWQPSLGAWRNECGTHFRVWAPAHQQVELVLDLHTGAQQRLPLARDQDGMCHGTFDVPVSARYAYLLDKRGPFPDPASRYQPDGVHRASAVIDARAFAWTDNAWTGRRLRDLTIYELHVGTFTPEGTFQGVMDRLTHLRDLAVGAIELMPVAEFPGGRNWGYDGVAPFAPSSAYGRPDDLRRLVDAAHHVGLAVLLDVVYNHFGPDGAYFSEFTPLYFSSRHETPWGQAINLDGPESGHVREFFIENALHWIHEYHVDGLRFDATHALVDESPQHLIKEIARRVRQTVIGRHVILIAEDERNLATIVTPTDQGGWGLDAVWADDFHHQVRRLTAGDADGYFQDFSGTTDDLAQTVRRGWFFSGQYSAYRGGLRGTDPAGVPCERMIIALQNHDQIGNRAFGERLHHQIDDAAFRAASALLLLAPETPLMFMGQEWGASTPFLYFTSHRPEIGRLVTAGRREEFARFTAFADPETRARIPDPQAASTFDASRLQWAERSLGRHAQVERLYRALLQLRRDAPTDRFDITTLDSETLALTRSSAASDTFLILVRFRGQGRVSFDGLSRDTRWASILTTEDPEFTESPQSIEVAIDRGCVTATFARPSAIVLRAS